MAKEDEKPTPVDKGKGKASDTVDGASAPEKDKDGKIIKDGQKGGLPAGMFAPSAGPLGLSPAQANGVFVPQKSSARKINNSRASSTCWSSEYWYVSRACMSRMVTEAYSNLLQESDTSLYKPALEAIKNFIKTSTSSMTAVPKPLKFLRPHYEKLEKAYELWPAGDNKVRNLTESIKPVY